MILAHREKLIDQTLSTLRTIGVTCESVVASKKQLHHQSNAYVSMIQTLRNRLVKDANFLRDVGLIIVDECHLDFHKEVFEYYPNSKILGVTATPISMKKISFAKCGICGNESDTIDICCGFEMYEYTRQFTYSEIYENIIIGQSISQLIMNDRLVRDINYEIGNCNRSKFTIDSKTGDFDKKSTDEYFGEFNVVKNYEEICKNEKTIIFNSSTKTNLKCYNDFIDAGYNNVRILDSVNTKKSEIAGIMEWFDKTPNAILANVDVLTAGFDQPDIQAVILNRSTLSLSLYLQMVGRGGRKCETIYKPTFKVIDGGGNIRYFAEKYGNSGKWSDEYDWKSIFYGTNEKAKPKKEPLEQVKECSGCGALISRAALSCEYCGEIEPQKKKRELSVSDEVATLIDEIPLPDGIKIVQYCERIGADKNFAWLILQNQIIELFIRHGVTFGTYQKTQNNGKFEISIRKIIKQPYQIIQGSLLESGTMRTKAWIIGRIKNKLDKYYSK